ncbi:MAG TPA: hypothetical protein VF463_00805 [Sphingobium sp.]
MALYTTIHLHNVPEARTDDYASWFDDAHRDALKGLRGLVAADRFEVTAEQIMPDVPQPWRYLSVYDFDLPDPLIDLPALGPLIASARDAGLIEDDDTERLYSYELYFDWKASPNWQKDKPLSGVNIILANYTPGRFDEWLTWYTDVHSVEVSNCPGNVGMKIGALSPFQIEPRRHCIGDQLVMTGQQTDDLAFTVMDFGMRALGKSPSGIAMEPRSSAGSLARTVHYFKKISGPDYWPGGIAYAGDWSPYPGRG